MMRIEELTPFEEYIHIITLFTMGLLMFISAYEVCVSSINDQPQIKYRFTTMLFCFVQLIITLMATLYFLVTEQKWRSSIALFMRLCGVTGRILAVLCCYSFILTIIKSLYKAPIYKHNAPRWFRAFIKILCILIMLIDIIQTIISFSIHGIDGTTYLQNIFMFILETWILLFNIALFIALLDAKKQTTELLKRAKGTYGNNVMTPSKPSVDAKQKKMNPSSSQFNIKNVVLPKTVNLMDIDGKSMRSKYINNEPYEILKKRLFKIYLLLFLNFVMFSMLILGVWHTWHLYKMIENHRYRFPLLTESPMSSFWSYLVYNGMAIIFITALLWWLYIPKSLCCDNVARDSLLYFCCVQNCCLVFSPSEYNNANQNEAQLQNEENSEDFDFFNAGTWTSAFRMTSYRFNENSDRQSSITFDSVGDIDYNDIVTNRATDLPNWKPESPKNVQKKQKVHDNSVELQVVPVFSNTSSVVSTRL